MKNLLFAAGVIWYHPSQKEKNKVFEYSKSFDQVFVFDNTECDDESLDSIKLAFPKNVSYITENENKGLPYVYNYFLKICSSDSIDFLCILDQDSLFADKDIQEIKKCLNDNYNAWQESVAIVAPRIDFGNGAQKYSESYSYVKWTISSGSFLNCLLLSKEEIKYDENYFVDRVDADFCFQIKKANKEILICNNSVLRQKLGDKVERKHPNHSPIRHYYIFRDRLYFNKKYFGTAERILKDVIQAFRHILLILLYENEKKKKIKECFVAFIDYRKGIMGKK